MTNPVYSDGNVMFPLSDVLFAEAQKNPDGVLVKVTLTRDGSALGQVTLFGEEKARLFSNMYHAYVVAKENGESFNFRPIQHTVTQKSDVDNETEEKKEEGE